MSALIKCDQVLSGPTDPQDISDIAPQATALIIEPEFRDLIPPLRADEFAQLEANILRDGCRDPLVLWCDVLLDGHHRYDICVKHNLPFKTVQQEGLATLEDAYAWMARNQLGRRNIPDFLRVELALLAKPALTAQAKVSQQAALKQGNEADSCPQSPVRPNSDERGTRTDDAVAKLAGVGRDTVRKVEKVLETATPDVIAKARAGEISINAAAKTVGPPKASLAGAPLAGAASAPGRAASIAPEVAPSLPAPTDDAQADFGPSPEEVAASILAEAEQLDYIKNLLANEDDPLTKALADLQQMRAVNSALKSQNDGYQNTISEQIRTIRSLRSKLAKLEPAV